MSTQLSWAAVWGVCFLLWIVVQQSMLRLTAESDRSFYLLLAIVMLVLFLTLVFHVRGYSYLGQIYDIATLRWISLGFILSVFVMYPATIASVYAENIGADTPLIDALIGFCATLYVAGLVGLGFGALSLRNKLGLPSMLPSLASSLMVLYVLYILVPALFGFDPPRFLGTLVWLPVPEALFVMASIVLFLRAARE